MRRRVRLVVAATTSAVILCFVIPLCLLVKQMAEDRAIAAGRSEAQSIGIILSTRPDPKDLADAMAVLDNSSHYTSAVSFADGTVIGRGAATMAGDPLVEQARNANTAFTALTATGGSALVPIVSEAGTEVVRTQVPAEAIRSGVLGAWLIIIGTGIFLLLASSASPTGWANVSRSRSSTSPTSPTGSAKGRWRHEPFPPGLPRSSSSATRSTSWPTGSASFSSPNERSPPTSRTDSAHP